MGVSIKEVAVRAGVSASTVSRVLSGHPTIAISEATRGRVRQAAQELQYRPSSIARALVRKHTDMIGVVLPPSPESSLRHPFFGTMFDGVLQAAAKRHLNVAVFTGQAWVDARTSLEGYRDARCDGLLLFHQPQESDIIPALLDAHIPIALVNSQRNDPRLSWVDIDNIAAARDMIRYLIRLGHQRIALMGHSRHFHFAEERIYGYTQALTEHNIVVQDALISTECAPWELQRIVAQLIEFLAMPSDRRPTAIFCLADEVAAIVLNTLMLHGVRVPDEISVAGFNDDGAADRQHPSLTTVRQPYERIAGAALDFIRQQIQDISQRGQKIQLATELVVRDSTAPPPGTRYLAQAREGVLPGSSLDSLSASQSDENSKSISSLL